MSHPEEMLTNHVLTMLLSADIPTIKPRYQPWSREDGAEHSWPTFTCRVSWYIWEESTILLSLDSNSNSSDKLDSCCTFIRKYRRTLNIENKKSKSYRYITGLVQVAALNTNAHLFLVQYISKSHRHTHTPIPPTHTYIPHTHHT